MIRECTETDREILESYLEEDSYGQAIFHLIDEFGFEQKFQSVYMDIEEEQCKGVYLMIYKNVLLYSKENQVEIDFLEQMLSVLVPEMVIGRKDNVNIVSLQERENIGEEHDLQPVVAQSDDLRVVVEDGQQEVTRQQHQCDGRAEGNGVLDQAEVQRFAAAADLARAVVLADKRRAGLIIGVHHVIGEDLDVVGGARGCHNDLAEAVDGGR